MPGILKSAIEKTGVKGKFWVCVIGSEEVLAYDPKILEYEGKEIPFEIGTSGTGKKFVKFPREGFQGKSGGFQRGRSDKELYLQALTMSMAYAKDIVVAEKTAGRGTPSPLIILYKEISKAILADLKAIEGEVPKQEAPKTETKAPGGHPQETSPPQAGKDTGTMTVKQKLEKEMWDYLRNKHADNDVNFKALLIEITEFQGTNKETGEPEPVFIEKMDDKRFSDKWASKAIGAIRKLVEQEERKAVNNMDDSDIRY